MSAQHTPGPWKVIHTPTRKETFWAISTTNDAPIQAVIALVDGVSKAHQEKPSLAEGNALLIAAAPELLAACEATATLAYELMERAARIDRLLIAKDGREPDCELGEIVRLRGQLSRNVAAIAKAKGAA